MGLPATITAEDYDCCGLAYYQRNRFVEALNFYYAAVQKEPQIGDYYYMRALCFFRIKQYNNALQEAERCIQINGSSVKPCELKVDIFIRLGLLKRAEETLHSVVRLFGESDFTENRKLIIQRCNEHFNTYTRNKSTNHALAFEAINAILSHSKSSVYFMLCKADLLALMGRLTEVKNILRVIPEADAQNGTCSCVRERTPYEAGHYERVISDFKRLPQLLAQCSSTEKPLVKNSMLRWAKLNADDAIADGYYDIAVQLYSIALEIDPSDNSENSKMYLELSIILTKSRRIIEALDYCTKAIELQSNYWRAYLKRALILRDLMRFRESICDFFEVIKLMTTDEYVKLLDKTLIESLDLNG